MGKVIGLERARGASKKGWGRYVSFDRDHGFTGLV